MISLSNFIEAIVNREKYGNTNATETVTINIPSSLYYKQMAVHTAVGLIANSISMSEIATYRDGKQVKEDDYYTLNVSPNPNQTSSQFWHKVIEQMLATSENPGEALVVETAKGNLYCADSFGIDQEKPIEGNIYSNVTIDTFSFQKKFNSDQVYLFKLSSQPIIELIDGMYREYGEVLQDAITAFRNGNGKKYKLHMTGAKAGDEKFNEEFENIVKKQLESYLKSTNAVYPEFDGYDLKPDENIKEKTADDMLKVRKDMFEMVAGAYKIPMSLMTGNITNMKDIMDEFLTFAVDPIAVMITEVLNKHAGYENWRKGNVYKVRTSGIYHRDIFNLAPNIDKLIASGFGNIDEVRVEAGWDELNTPWSKQQFMTKNYEKIETLLENIEEGGE